MRSSPDVTFATPAASAPSRPRTGLVLGAGGVRGCAHAGVVAVLEERGVPIDLVVGASAGSIFGLGVAAGVPGRRMVEIVHQSTPGDLARFYANRLRPGRGNHIGRLLLEAGEGKTFDDLELPFAVTATDIETGKPAVINSGPVLDAVQASIALPFIARPVRLDGHYYVDGGLFETTPVHVARAMGAQHIISVCLGFNYHAPKPFKKRPWMQGMLRRVGAQRWVPRGSFLDQVRFFCHLVAETYDPLPPSEGDITIRPDLEAVSPNSMNGAHFCLEQGLSVARAMIAP